jgi:predicted metal-dependent phosphotriesterase family hydrolase
LKVFGSIALNSPVGGLNPKAVEVAIGFGAKVVWMSTVSCKNHVDKHSGHGFKFPPLKQPLTVREEPLRYFDAHGNLIPEAIRVLEVMAQNPEVVLATGHGNRDEIDAIIRKAASIGLKRILVDHPYYMIDATLEDMKAWRSLGAYIEFTAVTSVPASKLYCIPMVDIAGYIKALGSERLILSPVDGMAAFVEHLLAEGLEEKSIRKMLTENPSQLLNL